MIRFQYYSNKVKSPVPLGFTDLGSFIQSTRQPKNLDAFLKIQDAVKVNDLELKGKLKQNLLYYFTPSVIVEGGRKYDNIKKFTGLLVLDFDKINNAEELKKHLFNEYRYVVASYLSPSKKGVKAIVRIPEAKTIEEYKEYHYALEQTMENYDGYDGTTKNAVLPLFQSWDADILSRQNHDIFSDRLVNEAQFDYSPSEIKKVEVKNTDGIRVVAIFKKAIDNISGEGHPQLRSACLILGGYVASGYVSLHEAEDLADFMIKTHPYLRQKKSTYFGTAKWAIKQGMNRQLILE